MRRGLTEAELPEKLDKIYVPPTESGDELDDDSERDSSSDEDYVLPTNNDAESDSEEISEPDQVEPERKLTRMHFRRCSCHIEVFVC